MARLNPGTRIYGTGTVDSTLFLNGGINSTNTLTGSLVALGGIGVGGTVQANQIVATNLSNAASTTIDSKVANGNYSLNFLARVGAGSYNPLTQQDDSLIYWTNNNSQGFGNLVIAPWSSTSTGIRITNTGTVQLPSLNSATSITSGALTVAGGVGVSGALYVQNLRVGNPPLSVGSLGTYSIVKGESWFYTNSFTDPDSGVLRSMKIGDSGLAVTGGIKSDNFTATNAITITSNFTATNTTTGALVVPGGAALGYNLIVGNQALVGQTSVNVIGISGGFVASPAFIVGGQTTESMYIRRQGSGNYALQTYNSGNVGNVAIQPYGGQVSIGTNAVTQPNASASTSTNTGMVVVGGGIGVGDSVYVGNRVGFVNNVNVSAVYQVYNTATQSLDTIFG
jgi:hypothetical protein